MGKMMKEFSSKNKIRILMNYGPYQKEIRCIAIIKITPIKITPHKSVRESIWRNSSAKRSGDVSSDSHPKINKRTYHRKSWSMWKGISISKFITGKLLIIVAFINCVCENYNVIMLTLSNYNFIRRVIIPNSHPKGDKGRYHQEFSPEKEWRSLYAILRGISVYKNVLSFIEIFGLKWEQRKSKNVCADS